jgi:hypothetical protein
MDDDDRLFRLFIVTENDAFDGTNRREACPREIARILRECADRIESDGVGSLSETIRDINGNDVGRYALKTVGTWA